MNLQLFYDKQKELELFVQKNIGMTEEEFSSVGMVDKRIFAFKVELAEFSNETAWFKYWKQSHVMDLDKVLEELADCVHFLLAIGIYRKYTFIKELDWERWSFLDEAELYTSVMENGIGSAGQWKTVFEYLLCIGHKLGFTIEQITLCYLMKNEKNIQRQKDNY